MQLPYALESDPALRKTKEPRRIKISNRRVSEIEELIESWTFETKEFMLQRLNQYRPDKISLKRFFKDKWYWLMDLDSTLKFKNLKNHEILTNWKERFQISGEENPTLAWNKILEKEVSYEDREYIVSRLKEETSNTFIPPEVVDFFEKIYKAHIRKEYVEDPALPKAPMILVIGPSGSGKTATVQSAIEQVIFEDVVKPEKDYSKEVDELLANKPFWVGIEDVNPELADEIEKAKRIKSLKRKLKIPIYGKIIRKKVTQELLELEEKGILLHYRVITPNDYNTAWSHEPGNFLKEAMGHPKVTCLRHMEEAHSACGKKNNMGGGSDSHIKTLVDTMNILLDEISDGKRDCLLFMTTDQADKFENAIYRRIVEKGKIVDMMEFWKKPENLEEVIKIELKRKNILIKDEKANYQGEFKTVTSEELKKVVDKVYPLFEARTLNMTPAYVRKLISSVIEMKGDIKSDYLDDKIVVREAFKNVARNIHGELYNKVVAKIPRTVKWDEYIGSVKDEFSRMANNCLLYNVSEEKGVVLAGPPGGGKTFLAQAWLGEHPEVTDLILTLNSLQDPNNPWDTTSVVDNLEKLYDIAKMVAPSFVYCDEGDALAPTRRHGESQSDKITNKWLSIIGGEKPLIGVFTGVSTNRLDIIDPALIRSKRLKTMNITGHMKETDIYKIIEKKIGNLPRKKDVSFHDIYRSAKTICHTPADYTAFVEEMVNMQKTEYEVIQQLKNTSRQDTESLEKIVKLNYKTLVGVIENLSLPHSVKTEAKKKPEAIMESIALLYEQVDKIKNLEDYPITKNHVETVKVDIARSPTRKGVQQLDEFVHAQLSKEPQVGFVVGVGVMGETLGILLPIGTSLTYKTNNEKIKVTGAVKPSGGIGTAEIEMAVEMMKQSSEEALILVENYLQALCPQDNIAKILGDFLENTTIHHQLLTAQYMGGGPSAGFALTINTLSAILNIPVCNDFGITGAPWTKGVTKGEVGSSVIIGGHAKKTERVLQELQRMYMPQKNYEDMDLDFLTSYWEEGKDVLGVKDFRSLLPEVLSIDDKQSDYTKNLVKKRVDHKKDVFVYYSKDTKVIESKEQEIKTSEEVLRNMVEREIIRRVGCIKDYLANKDKNNYLSFDEIFKQKP
ncbi:AAA family ATPase [Candidatus Woesearchaeota archaeon]|nr:AAA family ATPase [Candidatus Woesearchaeota archaeon]